MEQKLLHYFLGDSDPLSSICLTSVATYEQDWVYGQLVYPFSHLITGDLYDVISVQPNHLDSLTQTILA